MALVATLALTGFPTVATDLYNTQDLSNRDPAPGFRWTLVLSPEEQAALEWIRRTTPSDAIVQVEPYVRHTETWAYIPAFAERRMSAGLPISMIPLHKYQVASERVRLLYRGHHAGEIHEGAVRRGINYLVVGPPERSAYPGFETLLDGRRDLFPPAYRNSTITIYSVALGKHAP